MSRSSASTAAAPVFTGTAEEKKAADDDNHIGDTQWSPEARDETEARDEAEESEEDEDLKALMNQSMDVDATPVVPATPAEGQAELSASSGPRTRTKGVKAEHAKKRNASTDHRASSASSSSVEKNMEHMMKVQGDQLEALMLANQGELLHGQRRGMETLDKHMQDIYGQSMHEHNRYGADNNQGGMRHKVRYKAKEVTQTNR